MPPTFRISSAVKATAPPPIPLAFAWSQAYDPAKNGGRPLINMSQGVPGSPPDERFITSLAEVGPLLSGEQTELNADHWLLCRAAQTIKDPMSHRYGAILGETALREALAEEWKDIYARGVKGWGGEDGTGVTAQDIGVVCGANMVSPSLSVGAVGVTWAKEEGAVKLTIFPRPRPRTIRRARPGLHGCHHDSD